MTKFEKEMQQEMQRIPSPGDYLIALAREYHEATEAYDRRVCTGPIVNGSILPATGLEAKLISKHAREIKLQLERKAAAAGFNAMDLHRAIINYRLLPRR